MSDEIRIYHVDDPNDAPNRRPSALPTINPWLQTPLPSFVIPPVADRLQAAMSYWLHSAYMQGMAYQQQQQQQQRQLEQLQHQRQLQHQLQQQQQQQTQQQQQQQQSHHPPHHNPGSHHDPHQMQHDIQPSPSAASTAQMTSSSSSSSSSSVASCSSSSTSSNSPQSTTNGFDHPPHHHHPHHHHNNHHHHNHHHPHHHHHHNDHHEHHNHHRSDSVEQEQTPHQPHIKKPLNPFMIFMQKQRPQIVRQGIIKESAAINQLLGQQWRKLSREEQEPYYKLAEEEKLLHAQKYPGWSARDNYANQKRRKKLKFKTISLNGIDQSAKKCRARFGIGHMGMWCKPCKRKKKCIYSTRATIINNNNNQP